MGLLQRFKNFVYQLMVRYQVILYLIPVLQLFTKHFADTKKRANHRITDRSGKSLRACKFNGKLFPAFGLERLRTIPNISIRRDDVMLCGYPKTGSHWVHEILHMLVNGKSELSKHGKGLGGMIDVMPDIIIDSLSSPRVLNSHFVYEDLPKGVREHRTKIVLTVRNPKDTVVSFYNHVRNLEEFYTYTGEFKDYFELWIEGNVDYGSYFDFYLSWDELLKNQERHPVLLVKYEDIKAQPMENIKRIAQFLEVDVTDKFVAEIVEKTSFDSMKSKRAKATAAKLFRKGKVGDWRNWLSEEQSEAVDKEWRTKMFGCTLYQPHYE
ncbi:sulfotransferase 6B1 [Aplysia californica]|uniref:Sulfotransferase 6B1 n=1 Tax=Aplysia californica TaxID=6500 RepID=A0ABM1A6Z5_APLCA|nr:sulfotransferase 6B1 [Aplysia californica]